MNRKKLLEDIKANPARFYRTPADVLRDRRFADADKREILQAWRRDGAQVDAAIAELESRFAADGHAAE